MLIDTCLTAASYDEIGDPMASKAVSARLAKDFGLSSVYI
jgi:hypothetical protein